MQVECQGQVSHSIKYNPFLPPSCPNQIDKSPASVQWSAHYFTVIAPSKWPKDQGLSQWTDGAPRSGEAASGYTEVAPTLAEASHISSFPAFRKLGFPPYPKPRPTFFVSAPQGSQEGGLAPGHA